MESLTFNAEVDTNRIAILLIEHLSLMFYRRYRKSFIFFAQIFFYKGQSTGGWFLKVQTTMLLLLHQPFQKVSNLLYVFCYWKFPFKKKQAIWIAERQWTERSINSCDYWSVWDDIITKGAEQNTKRSLYNPIIITSCLFLRQWY